MKLTRRALPGRPARAIAPLTGVCGQFVKCGMHVMVMSLLVSVCFGTGFAHAEEGDWELGFENPRLLAAVSTSSSPAPPPPYPPQPPSSPPPPYPPEPASPSPPLVSSTPPPDSSAPPPSPIGHPTAAPPSPPAVPPPPPINSGSPTPEPPSPPSYPPTYASSFQPPPPGVDRLPPTNVGLVTISATNGSQVPATSGMGLVKIQAAFGANESWSFVCGDPWAGFDANAANAACRQAGYPAGGEPLRVWRSGTLPPMFLGRLVCDGSEQSLSHCVATGSADQMIDYWQLGVNGTAAAGACEMLAGVRCRTGAGSSASVILRIANIPSPSGTNITGNYNGTAIRLEASVGNGPFKAVCLDDGFDDDAATVSCRSLGFRLGGQVYPLGGAKGTPNTGVVNSGSTFDAQGSYLGTVSSVRCGGSEANLTACASWRTTAASAAIPCRAAAWVVCKV